MITLNDLLMITFVRVFNRRDGAGELSHSYSFNLTHISPQMSLHITFFFLYWRWTISWCSDRSFSTGTQLLCSEGLFYRTRFNRPSGWSSARLCYISTLCEDSNYTRNRKYHKHRWNSNFCSLREFFFLLLLFSSTVSGCILKWSLSDQSLLYIFCFN